MFRKEAKDWTGYMLENRFELASVIGAGGMATVYKANHRQVDLTVAVKILNKNAAFTEIDLERLKREAKALNSLFHPNIVQVYSFGVLDDDVPYLVLDYLEGRSLAELIEENGFQKHTWSVDCFQQICSGLSYAHENGLIHRDLKPSNVMVLHTPKDEATIKLLDFGLVKAQDNSEQKLTRSGEVHGSPLYMSPEQIQGKEADVRSDIYSLGCLMYETISGKPPLAGDTPIMTFMKHLQELPTPFSAVSDKIAIPQKLEELIFRCLQKEPAKRYQSVSEISSDLENCLN